MKNYWIPIKNPCILCNSCNCAYWHNTFIPPVTTRNISLPSQWATFSFLGLSAHHNCLHMNSLHIFVASCSSNFLHQWFGLPCINMNLLMVLYMCPNAGSCQSDHASRSPSTVLVSHESWMCWEHGDIRSSSRRTFRREPIWSSLQSMNPWGGMYNTHLLVISNLKYCYPVVL